MPPQTPVILVDSVYDTINLYPNATLVVSSERAGHEGFRVADYRRERTSWQPVSAAANHYAYADLGVGATHAVDYVFVDRGHNLWGKTLQIAGDNGSGGGTVTQGLTVPAIGTLGGDPSAGICVTEEGALYSLFAPLAAKRRWLTYVVDNMVPVVPGLMLGLRHQLLGYSNTFDEDAGERTEVSTVSAAGYRGTDTTYSWRTIELGLSLIGAADYDASVRALREMLYRKNQPWVCAMDWGTHPERAWMYQAEGKSWSAPKKRVYRETRIRGREVGQSLA